jgi:hypothetical protein
MCSNEPFKPTRNAKLAKLFYIFFILHYDSQEIIVIISKKAGRHFLKDFFDEYNPGAWVSIYHKRINSLATL